VWTKDFRTFEANPRNPVFMPSKDKAAWDCDGVLTPQVIEIDGTWYMVYAGRKGREWQTGIAAARKQGDARERTSPCAFGGSSAARAMTVVPRGEAEPRAWPAAASGTKASMTGTILSRPEVSLRYVAPGGSTGLIEVRDRGGRIQAWERPPGPPTAKCSTPAWRRRSGASWRGGAAHPQRHTTFGRG